MFEFVLVCVVAFWVVFGRGNYVFAFGVTSQFDCFRFFQIVSDCFSLFLHSLQLFRLFEDTLRLFYVHCGL